MWSWQNIGARLSSPPTCDSRVVSFCVCVEANFSTDRFPSSRDSRNALDQRWNSQPPLNRIWLNVLSGTDLYWLSHERKPLRRRQNEKTYRWKRRWGGTWCKSHHHRSWGVLDRLRELVPSSHSILWLRKHPAVGPRQREQRRRQRPPRTALWSLVRSPARGYSGEWTGRWLGYRWHAFRRFRLLLCINHWKTSFHIVPCLGYLTCLI